MFLNKFLIILLIISLGFWYSLVYSNFYKSLDFKFLTVSSKNIYPDSEKLNSTIVVFNSNTNISKYNFSWACEIETEFLYNKNDNYFFNVKLTDINCKNPNFYLQNNEKKYINANFKLNIITYFDLFNKFSDYNNATLTKLNNNLSKTKDKYKLFASIDNSNLNYDFIKKSRIHNEIEYQSSIIKEIQNKRNSKLLIPVSWYILPTRKDKIPNFSRNYRIDHTDWIHHGWDIDAPFWTPVIAVSDWIIIRVLKDFEYKDLYKIKKTWTITDEDKIINLDIYRWNQVWLKTSNWDVFIYAHLDEVYNNIENWSIIKKWIEIWTIWISWVPDKSYSDYHLHFEIQKNPHFKNNAWKNTYLDIMKWDWYFKWETREYILANQYNIFEN